MSFLGGFKLTPVAISIFSGLPSPHRAESRGCPSVKAEKPTDLTHQQSLVNDMMVKPKVDLRLILEENFPSLPTYYALNVPESGIYMFGPFYMINCMIQRSWVVNCTRRSCPKDKTGYLTMIRLTGINQASITATTIAGHDLVLRRVSSNPTLNCMALLLSDILTLQDLEGSSSGPRNVDLEEAPHERREMKTEAKSGSDNGDTDTDMAILSILQGDECVPCCIQAAIRYREGEATPQIVET